MKSDVLELLCFGITSKVTIGNASKLLFTLTSDYKKGIIAFFHPFDLFKGPLVILVGCNNVQHGSVEDFIEVEVKLNPKSMRIAVISESCQDGVIQLIIIFCLKFHEIYLNRLPKTIILNIHCLVLMNLVYDILVE